MSGASLRPSRGLRGLLPLLALAALGGCSDDATEVLLTIDAECDVRARATSVDVHLARPDGSGPTSDRSFSVGADGSGWPRSITLAHERGDADTRFVVTVSARDASGVLFTTATEAGYRAHVRSGLSLVLAASCLERGCDAYCDASGCAEAPGVAEALPDYREPSPACAGPVVDGGLDGGVDAASDAGADAAADAGTDASLAPQVIQVTAGAYFSCLLRDDGQVFCWGWNAEDEGGEESLGYLGNGNVANLALPQDPVCTGTPCTPIEAESIASYLEHTCAVLVDGQVACWGVNSFGQVDGILPASWLDNDPKPRALILPLEEAEIGGARVAEVDVGIAHSCIRTQLADGRGGEVRCWGARSLSRLGRALADGYEGRFVTPNLPADAVVLDLSVGRETTLVLLQDGRVFCWGSTANYGCGTEGGTGALASTEPVEVPLVGLTPVAVAAGGQFGCVLVDGGGVYCWGRNDEGQLGHDTDTSAEQGVPSPVLDGSEATVTDISQLALGHNQAIAIEERTGTLYVWGTNASGVAGTGTFGVDFYSRATPLGFTADQAAAGSFSMPLRQEQDAHSCALPDGVVYCWGDNGFFQVGVGSTESRSSPTEVDLSRLP